MKKYSAEMLWSRWLLGAIICAGVLCGMLAAGILEPDVCQELGQDLSMSYPDLRGKELSINVLENNMFEMLKIYFFGLCLLGIVLIPAYLFFKSFSLGFVILFMLTQNPWQDWSIVLGAVLAPQFLFFPLIIAASACMLKMSLVPFYYNKQELFKEIMSKSAIMLILLFLTVLVSLIIGGLISKLF